MLNISAQIPLVVLFGFSYGVLLWISILFWVTRDSLQRTPNTGFHIFAILLNLLLPGVGLLIYLLVRPEKSMLEVFHDELERRAFGERQMGCSDCGGLNPEGSKFCVFCGEKLHRECPECGKENGKGSFFCGECGSEMEIKTSKKKK